jgi:hypothetical protein
MISAIYSRFCGFTDPRDRGVDLEMQIAGDERACQLATPESAEDR